MTQEDPITSALTDLMTAAMTEQGGGDGYVAVIVDSLINEVDAYGPLNEMAALAAADRMRTYLNRNGLADIGVGILRFHHLAPGTGTASADQSGR